MMYKKSALALALVAVLCGCHDDSNNDDTSGSNSGYSNSVSDGQTLTNTDDVVAIGQDSGEDSVTITIGATSDIHGRLFAYDYATLSEDADTGLTKIESVIDTVRQQDQDALFIDIGDTVQGNSAALFNDYDTHPMVDALNTLQYNVWVPGNHEFNFERSFIDRNLENFGGAVISSNIKWSDSDVNYIKPYQIFNIKGVTVAVVAVTPSNVPNWEASSPDHFANLAFEDELASVRDAVDEAISQYNPDVVIGAFHLGRSENGTGTYRIASELADKFDVIFAGHEHAEYIEMVEKDAYSDSYTGTDIANNDQEDKSISGTYDQTTRESKVKIIEPGKWGWALATANIELKKDADGAWQMVDTTLANHQTNDVEEDPNGLLYTEFSWVHEESVADTSQQQGVVTGNFTPSSTGYADEATGEDFDVEADRLYSTIHYAKVHDTPLIDFINQIQIQNIAKAGYQVDVSAASLFSDQTNLVDGEAYTKAKSANLYKYDNTLLGVNITGANLKKFMEWSYSYFNTYTDGDLTYSFNPNANAYNYDQFDGDIQYTVDLTGDAYSQSENQDGSYTVTNPGSRIEITSIGGQAFDANATYKIAVNNYRYGTQLLTYGWVSSDDVFYESTNEEVYAVRDMLTEYASQNSGVDVGSFSGNTNWSFVQDAAIEAARSDGGQGQALWQQLQSKQICVQIEPGSREEAISVSLNPSNTDSYYANPTGTAAGCN
ncbi:2',3'-cyclic-nucleotide 2'-phosphodiesterase / 3'-nucleotidase [Vibrio xiamenensis]|uniref:2',3'-cyclic-nucleotide 2'-phosphodiesterase / 3'-nucleotidase n=1 Tax=Vibrio xiamenensis TaxID=861298 RepID=A0A1G8CSL5_9VIBR|nr:5'-nucleotidase C-terminal domain-containing protein [Vibrio xiamenensis]SDH48418.1 2',3'-cyclic-nucleotide 2'-phosphodiesterase / 3'-nucleotidase [Vibrio xiamenensis]